MSADNPTEKKDIDELKEFMFRSSEQLKYLSEGIKSTNFKIDLLAKDVTQIQSDLKTHPLLCPINPEKIQEMVRHQLAKLPERRLDILNKLLPVVALIISALALAVVYYKH
jgi:hypothetical protein